jgi:hypothetical protein
VLGHDAVVDGEVGVELGEGGGHDALPLDAHRMIGCDDVVMWTPTSEEKISPAASLNRP